MINLLLVDDEALSIEILLKGIEWEKLNIDNVFTAMSMKQACALFKKNQIDIMICDIEMPQNSGIELLKWVRQNNYKTINIFLTGHADFEYAQKAIELESMDYLLKPISFDKMKKIVLQAVDRVKKREKEYEIEQIVEKWQLNKPKILEQFWREIITSSISSSVNDILTAAKNRNIVISNKKIYIPILASSKKEIHKVANAHLPKWELNIKLNKLLLETFPGLVSPLISLDSRKAVFILETETNYNGLHKNEKINSSANIFIKKSKELLDIVFSIVIGNQSFINHLAQQISELTEIEEDYVLDESRIMFLSKKRNISSIYNQPDLTLWYKMFKQGELDNLTNLINNYLKNEKEKSNLCSATFTQLQHDYLQMVYSVLEEYDISANFIFDTDEAEDLFSKATISISNMKNWIYYVNTKSVSYFTAEKDTRNIIERVENYIENNIYNDISRDDIANEVNLNPEYLSRLYHKETGVHLMKYIQNEKIAKAKNLLLGTDYNIGELASKLGYSNFAYFSHLFKKITGYSPNEYRKLRKMS